MRHMMSPPTLSADGSRIFFGPIMSHPKPDVDLSPSDTLLCSYALYPGPYQGPPSYVDESAIRDRYLRQIEGSLDNEYLMRVGQGNACIAFST